MPLATIDAQIGTELARLTIGPGHDSSSTEHGRVMGFEPNLAGPATTGPAWLPMILKVSGHIKTFCRTHHFRTYKQGV